MKEKLVTVFIPLYNCEQYINKCLDSVINQTYKNLDILVIDDGSTDNSYEIVRQVKDERVRILRNEENRGIPYTRNRGLEEAKGEYIVLVDSDDYSLPDRIKKQVEYMEKNKDVVALGTNFIVSTPFISRKIRVNKSPLELKIGLLFECQLANPTVILRKETLKKYNIKYNTNCFVAQDYELWTQITKIGDIAILPEILHVYKSGHDNITRKSISRNLERRKLVIDSIHNQLLDYYNFPLSSEQKSVFNLIFFESHISYFNSELLEDSIVMFNDMKNHINKQSIFPIEIYQKVLNEILVSKIAITKHNLWNKYKILVFYKKHEIINKSKFVEVTITHYKQILKQILLFFIK